MLEVIGRCCVHLRELDVTDTGITDSALMRLSYNETRKMPQCQKLERVCLTGCLLSPTGPAYLIHYLPRLYSIDYEQMFQVSTGDSERDSSNKSNSKRTWYSV